MTPETFERLEASFCVVAAASLLLAFWILPLLVTALTPVCVISTGGMVAGQRKPRLSRAQVEAMWRTFHARVSDPLAAAGIPLPVTPGNQDGSAYGGLALEQRI
jgi:hypothetical protein